MLATSYSKKEKASMLFPSIFINVFLFLLFMVPTNVLAQDPAMAAGVMAHKALYDVSLSEARNDSQIINISGKMLYEWQPSCDAWVSKHKFDLFYEYADSPATRMTSSFSISELFNGELMSFKTDRAQNGHLFEVINGYATKDPSGGAGEIVYSTPSDLGFALPNDVLFPMAHTIETLKHIKKGDSFYRATIFDGSDKKGPMEMNSFISSKPFKVVTNENSKLDRDLISAPAHKLRLAFFSVEQRLPNPDYEMDVVLHDNGVISDMHAEYKDFTVRQKLVALEPLPSTCVHGDDK
jgi:hypothetical protein